MNVLRPALFAATLLMIVSASCAPQLSLGQNADASPTATAQAQSVVPVTGNSSAPTALQPVTVANPPMEVGSIARYVDGSLLDAVPNNGPFQMGAAAPGAPVHLVTVSDFWIYSTEVSNGMYAWCVKLGKCTPPNLTDDPSFNMVQYLSYPVVGVNWQQASDYCGFVNGRLPTEAEWEKAATWDATLQHKRLYPWGDRNPSCEFLNYKYCLNRTASVTSYGVGASYYGVFNMEGNVYEWVGDWYAPDYFSDAPTQDPSGPATGTRRVIRSSAYDSDAIYASPTYRFSDAPTAQRADLGFRCVVKDPTYFAPFCEAPVFYGVDAASKGVSSKPCTDPTIVHAESCSAGNNPVDYVTVNATAPTTATVTGLQACDPANNDVGVQHNCSPGVTIQVTASCGVSPTSASACLPGYSPDPNNPGMCKATGGTGACAAGFQYDSKLQCCSAAPSNPAAAPLCTVGQHPYNGACVPDYGGPIQPNSITYTTTGGGCTTTTGNQGTGEGQGTLIPFPTGGSGGPVPAPGGGGQGSGKCSLKPKDCPYGLNRQACSCNPAP